LLERKQQIHRLYEALTAFLLDGRGATATAEQQGRALELASAISGYLYDDIDARIERLKQPPKIYRPQYSIDDLMHAQQELETAENGMNALDAMCEELRKAGQEGSAGFMEKTQRPALASLLDMQRARVESIQKALEAAAEPERPAT